MESEEKMKGEKVPPLPDGTIHSVRKNYTPLKVSPLKEYAKIVGEEKIEKLEEVSERINDLSVLEMSSTPFGGGVAEMLRSSVPFMNQLGIEDEWKVIRGSDDFFEVTKNLHHLLQGKKGTLTPEDEDIYFNTIKENVQANIIDYEPDVVFVHDPQPLALARELSKENQKWIWRCHIDIDEYTMRMNPDLWDFVTYWARSFDAVIFTAAHFVIYQWPLPKFIIPPFIDPLSEKNREMEQEEIDRILEQQGVATHKPIISQVSRFDPWKDPEGVVSIFKKVKQVEDCQLILLGGFAPDDPEGERIYLKLKEMIEGDEDIFIFNEWNDTFVNAIQRASTVIIQNSKKEGFGLTVTEAMWKGKPVLARPSGGIALQIRSYDNGYLFDNEFDAADIIVKLLRGEKGREKIGKNARESVRQNFLMPVRMIDYLLAIDTIKKAEELPRESIVSFHPWYKLSRRW
ncbi:MAG: glycosyltransferase [Archaeoglobaceae archaeon]